MRQINAKVTSFEVGSDDIPASTRFALRFRKTLSKIRYKNAAKLKLREYGVVGTPDEEELIWAAYSAGYNKTGKCVLLLQYGMQSHCITLLLKRCFGSSKMAPDVSKGRWRVRRDNPKIHA